MVQNIATPVETAVINPAIASANLEENVTTANAPAENTANTINEKEQETKTMFDFKSLFSREDDKDESLPKEILKESVDNIKDALKSYSQAVLSFHQRNQGTLYIELTVYKSRFNQTFWSAADLDLCYAVMNAFRGKSDMLNNYSVEKREPQRTNHNLVLDILKDFFRSKLQVRINKDYKSPDGKVFKNFVIHLSKTGLVKFCVENTQELNDLIKKTVA